MEFPQQIATFCFPTGCHALVVKKKKNSNKTSSTKIHNIPDPTICNLVLTSGMGHRLYLTTLTVFEQQKQVLDDNEKSNALPPSKRAKKSTINDDNQQQSQQDDDDQQEFYSIWVPKCIVLLSHYSYYHFQTSLLKELYYTVGSGVSPLPFERYIAHIIHDIPFPKSTTTTTSNNMIVVEWNSWIKSSSPIRLKSPTISSLSTSDQQGLPSQVWNVSLEPLFRTLSLSNILVLWATLLQEGKVVLSCHPNNIALLTPIAESLLSLLFPFEWQGIYIPVLPSSSLIIIIGYIRSTSTIFNWYNNNCIIIITTTTTTSWCNMV